MFRCMKQCLSHPILIIKSYLYILCACRPLSWAGLWTTENWLAGQLQHK
jgi:hypothetical protein